MSQWTHVNGSIRFDLLSLASPIEEPDMEIDSPEGSEGSLTISKTDVFRTENQVFLTVSISGDLRDFGKEDIPSIFDWLNKHTEQYNIRSGIIEIESTHTEIYKYRRKAGKFELVYAEGDK